MEYCIDFTAKQQARLTLRARVQVPEFVSPGGSSGAFGPCAEGRVNREEPILIEPRAPHPPFRVRLRRECRAWEQQRGALSLPRANAPGRPRVACGRRSGLSAFAPAAPPMFAPCRLYPSAVPSHLRAALLFPLRSDNGASGSNSHGRETPIASVYLCRSWAPTVGRMHREGAPWS